LTPVGHFSCYFSRKNKAFAASFLRVFLSPFVFLFYCLSSTILLLFSRYFTPYSFRYVIPAGAAQNSGTGGGANVGSGARQGG
jgi:hypothetical protein